MGLLAASFKKELEAFLDAHKPARALVGGLPQPIIEAIARSWSAPFQLYLVSKHDIGPLPPNVKRCGPDDLTAVRQGAWAALVGPQESSRIQESIRGAGAGTVREIWQTGFPWQPCELPGVRWQDVRDDLVKTVGLGPTAEQASRCIDQFREELRGEGDAAESFYGALDSLPGGAITYDDLCFQLGFPAHAPGSVLRKRGDRQSVLGVLDEFLDKFVEDIADEARDQLLDVAKSRYAGDAPKLSAIENGLRYFTDEFRRLPAADASTGVLAWRNILRGNRAHWQALATDVLASLLGAEPKALPFGSVILADGPGISLRDVGENWFIFRDRNSSSHALTATISFTQRLVDEAAKGAAAGAVWQLQARVNRTRSVLAASLPTTVGPYAYATPVPQEGKQLVRYAVGPNAGSERATSGVITLWECCEDFPLVVASAHSKARARRRKRSKDDQGKTIFTVAQVVGLPTQGRAVLHAFVYGPQGALSLTLGDSGPIVPSLSPITNTLCQEFSIALDATEDLEVRLTWTGASGVAHEGTINFEFKGEAGPREDSIAELLVRAHSGAPSKQLRDQLSKLKGGNPVSPGELPVRDSVKPIASWERYQQDTRNGWWPILAALNVELQQQNTREKPTGYLRISEALTLDRQANAWRNVVESPSAFGPMPSEIARYVEARTEVLQALAGQFSLAAGEAIDEVNIARTSVIGLMDVGALGRYVDAYSELLKAARRRSFPGEWRSVAWSVDSVVLFDFNATAPESQLLGPFHPISLARLHFVERCLVERLLDGARCSLARAFLHAQPLALGHVVDGQLQPSAGVAFPTGDAHWLWVYRQKGHASLPQGPLVAWLRKAGLDPQIGPLGVDADVLPDTIKQYLLAYPSRQTLRLALDDCSQATFEVLRDEMSFDDGAAEAAAPGLRQRLPGGISVYDPLTKLSDVDGEPIPHDPELALRWHHASAPAGLGIDIATLPPSNQVYFQPTGRGGAASSSVPTARRGLVQFGPYGLEVATEIPDSLGEPGLPRSTAEMIATYEPAGQQLSWGTSLSMLDKPKANWTLCCAGQVDPRLFIEYVVKQPGTALWTYRLFGSGPSLEPEFGRGHFLLARVSEALANGLDTLLLGVGIQVPREDVLREIAEAGLTLGDEFLRTGRAAEGALGQYLVQRLLWRPSGAAAVLPHWETSSTGEVEAAGFLLQVDPFRAVLGAFPGQDLAESDQRSDLISMHIRLCGEDLWIKPVVFESKLIRTGQVDIRAAAGQAEATVQRVDHLLESCLHDPSGARESWWSQPERLLLSDLIYLGLRIARGSFGGDPLRWQEFERRVLSSILSGSFKRVDATPVVIVHHYANTSNGCHQDPPHALVSFAEVNAVAKGNGSTQYQEISLALADIVRHRCGSAAPAERLPGQPLPPATQTTGTPPAPAPAGQPGGEATVPRNVAREKQIADAHAAFDLAFRNFIGNRQAIEKLRDDLVDALIKHPPHLPSAYLLTGNPSTGKTTLANRLASLLGVTFVKLVGTNIRSEADLIEQVDNAFRASGKPPIVTQAGSQGVPEYEYAECLIFIDEIHLVKGRAQEGLLTLTEPNDRYVRLRDRICRFPRATYVAATTRDSEIDKALRTRFGNPIHLNDYTVDEVAAMLRVKKDSWAAWPEEVRVGIARLSRCIPREAERMALKLERKLSVSREQVTLEVALERLRVEEGLDRNGLDQVCWATLRLLGRQVRPLGKEALAQQMGIADEDKLVSEIIPSLRSLGLVDQVAGGQVITDRGRNYLRNEAPPTAN